MGGINHQPCNKYIPESTMLSKVISDILAEFGTANSLLEDALLTEINGGGESEQEKYYMEQATEHLITTKNKLERAIDCIDHLLLKMEKLDFQDSEELDTITELENNLLSQQIIPERCSAWEEAVATIRQNINCCILLSCGQKRFPLFELIFALKFKSQDLIFEP